MTTPIKLKEVIIQDFPSSKFQSLNFAECFWTRMKFLLVVRYQTKIFKLIATLLSHEKINYITRYSHKILFIVFNYFWQIPIWKCYLKQDHTEKNNCVAWYANLSIQNIEIPIEVNDLKISMFLMILTEMCQTLYIL